MSVITLPEWPLAYGGPSGSGEIKTDPEDFIVDEILGFEAEGHGEHVFLQVEKIGENTEYLARLLARHAGVRQRDIGYAGLKDRHARTLQWFSIWLPGKADPDWSGVESDGIKILQAIRHPRKLKRGVLDGNRFEILVRHWQGNRDVAEQQLQSIKRHGFPNYFGEQRFGHQGRNVEKALAMFQGAKVKREQQAIYWSAARAFLFNSMLASRVAAGNWRSALPGDVFKLQGNNSRFRADANDSSLNERLERNDIHPTGALWGKGDSGVASETGVLEQAVIERYPLLAEGLIKAGLEHDRRALRAVADDLEWQFGDDTLRLTFFVPAGSYATTLLREIVKISERP